MKRVFISYCRNNSDIVKLLVTDLRDVGFNVWYDQNLSGGQKWWEQILAGIRDCDVFIFALSPWSLDSEACKSELEYVARLNKHILPLQVAEGVNLKLLPSPLNEFQVTHYRQHDTQASFRALVKSINIAPPTPPLPYPLPDPPPLPVTRIDTLKQRLDSREPLGYKSQLYLVSELEKELKKDPSARDLLLRLKTRDETLAKIAIKIDSALENHKDHVGGQLSQTNRPPKSEGLERASGDSGSEDNQTASQPRNCSQCGSRINPTASFCGVCGLPVSADYSDGSKKAADSSVSKRMEGSKVRQYRCDESKLPNIITNIKSWFESKNFKTQRLDIDENQSLLIQIKKEGSWRGYLGMDTTLNILFHYSNEILTVEIGAGKWADKAAAGAVGMFIFAPLAITAGIGAWEQMKMPDQIFDYIAMRLDYK